MPLGVPRSTSLHTPDYSGEDERRETVVGLKRANAAVHTPPPARNTQLNHGFSMQIV